MTYQRIIQCAISFLLIAMFLVGCAPATPAPTVTPTLPPAIPMATPLPGASLPLLTLVEYGYQFRYPPEYQAAVFTNQVCLSLHPVYAPPGRCMGQDLIIETVGAVGHTLSEWADLAVPNPTGRTCLMVSSEEAIQLEYSTDTDRRRLVIIIHGDRRYLVEFARWPEQEAETSSVGILYNTVLQSFEFLPDSSTVQAESGVSAILPRAIYNWPAVNARPKGTLEAGSAASVIGFVEGKTASWLHIVCPDGVSTDCWILWDLSAVSYYAGPPVPLNIPDPATLKLASTNRTISPDLIWEAVVTRSETVSLGGESSWFFYTRFTVTSGDGTAWTPVSEWRPAGVSEEAPPHVFHWSGDGRSLYFTSIYYPDAVCVFFHNIGANLERLDLTDGSVTELQPPHAAGYAAISPDETMLAYIASEPAEEKLVVRDLAKAFTPGDAQGSVQWSIGLKSIPHDVIVQLAWSPDSRKVWVTLTELEEDCYMPPEVKAWELDVATGAFIEVSSSVVPTPAP